MQGLLFFFLNVSEKWRAVSEIANSTMLIVEETWTPFGKKVIQKHNWKQTRSKDACMYKIKATVLTVRLKYTISRLFGERITM